MALLSFYKFLLLVALGHLLLVLYNYQLQLLQQRQQPPPVQGGHEQMTMTANHSHVKWHSSTRVRVEIWSKAAIGQYVWENVLRGDIDRHHSGLLYLEGETTLDSVTFTFRSGPSLKVDSLLSFPVRNLILVLNWRNQEKIAFSRPWLEAIKANDRIRNVGIIALGDEQCNNRWFVDYLEEEAGAKIRFLFVVYDWDQVDNSLIYQWPLGVATYRHFPSSDLSALNVQTNRPYVCNFIATVYPNSSRQELVSFFDERPEWRKFCIVKTRDKWPPEESEYSLDFYVKALQVTDLTLSPIGMNHECYRILEAVEYGSVPVVELNQGHLRREGNSCDREHSLRLFAELEAPFIYVTDWRKQLGPILQKQLDMSPEEKAVQRTRLIKWYHRFKVVLRNRLVNAILDKFI